MRQPNTKSPFETLGIAPTFELDVAQLDERHRALSGALHPDRYVGKPAAERRLALERAIEVNGAWRTLRDPIKRAETLLANAGVDVSEQATPKASPTLLMEMMEVREALSAARQAQDMARIATLSDAMRERERVVLKALAEGFSAVGDMTPAQLGQVLLPKLGELRYLRRFFEELHALEDELLG